MKIRGTEVKLVQGNITSQSTDAIVNAANPTLMGGGGVDGAIHRVGGEQIREECKQIRLAQYPDGLPAGEAVITGGGNLEARYVIHTVGPVWRGGDAGEEETLCEAYRSCLRVALKHGVRSVAFPSISTGAYGYPFEEAARAAIDAVFGFLAENEGLDSVTFVAYSDSDYLVYRRLLDEAAF